MKIIDDRVRELVYRIEDPAQADKVDDATRALIQRLRENCAHPSVLQRYRDYPEAQAVMEPLPLGQDGYVPGFDLLHEEDAFWACWCKYGIVASKQVIPPALCERALKRVYDLALAISQGRWDMRRPETWAAVPTDAQVVALLSRGFFEIYHDAFLAELRSSVRAYLHHVLIWGRPELWTTFDRVGVKLHGHEDAGALPLHVDQNPNVHPSFHTVQGVLALTDCPKERGTYVGVPGSKHLFADYAGMAKNLGEYVELDRSSPVAAILESAAQAFPLKAGTFLSWDSRTTHANSANESNEDRVVAYIAAGPAREEDGDAARARADGFRSGLGSNVRNAMMHASKPPRYTDQAAVSAVREPEQLNLLGRLLYGFERYLAV